ncbi:MAG: CAP domain-containing protein [Deinococcales bacterium]
MVRTSRWQVGAILLLGITACGTTPDPFVLDILGQVNAARASTRTCGSKSYPSVPALTWNSKLQAAARGHNQDMFENKFFSHTGSNGSSLGERIKAQGYAYSTAGENIAWGQPTTQSVMDAWLKSAGHCANIMNANYTEIGVAVLYPSDKPKSPYWTMNLAKPSAAKASSESVGQ